MSNVVIGSEIAEYYKNKSILITGGTGFIGKVLIEKLLRSCYDLKTIYVLVRSKKGVNPQSRLNELLHCKLFDTISQYYPEFRNKLVAIQGDLIEPNLGISDEDEKVLADNVNIVFHSAATVRFDEPLKLAVEMNIIGVKKMLDLAKKMKKLEVFVHVSTAYANCDRQHISEVVYNPPVQPDKLLEAVDWMEEDLMKLLTPKIIQFRPNTYTYTKAIAENLIIQAEKEIPFAIVRPSIVGASWREPFCGWIDNYNGPTALFVACGKGMLRTMLGNKNAIADIVPVDIPVNLMISTAWFRGSAKTKETIVYNCSTGQINCLKWGVAERVLNNCIIKNPYENIFWVPAAGFTVSKINKYLGIFFTQLLPSFLMDVYLRIANKKPIFMRVQSKLKKATETLEFFTTHQWEFTNDNIFMLLNQMNEVDNKIFNFDVRDLHWPTYIEQYCLGAKKYLLKEELSKMPQARKSLKMMQRIQTIVKYLIVAIFVKFILVRKYTLVQIFQFIYNLALKIANRIISTRI